MISGSIHRVMLVVQNPRLERALERLLMGAIDGIEVMRSDLGRAVEGASLGESAREAERLRSVHEWVTDRTYDVIVVDLSESKLGRKILETAARRTLRPFVIALAHGSYRGGPLDGAVDAWLVKFSADPSHDLGRNIVAKVKEALRRVFLRVGPPAPTSFDPAEHAWLAALRDAPLEEVGPPPVTLERRLRDALPQDARTVVEDQRRPRCLAFAGAQDLPWEWLLPPGLVKSEGRPFTAARIYPRRARAGPATPSVEGTPLPNAGGRLRAVHVVFPPVDESYDGDLEVEHDQSGIRGERGLEAVQRFAAHVGGACEPLQQRTLDDIVTACAGGVDLLHIACHARLAGGRGELRLSRNLFGDAEWIGAERLAERLTPSPPRVVVLEACTSGLGSGGVAAQLIRAGVEAVVCFQLRPSQELAAELVERFYEGLRETCALDHALWATRSAHGAEIGWAAMVVAIGEKGGLDVLSGFRRSASMLPSRDPG